MAGRCTDSDRLLGEDVMNGDEAYTELPGRRRQDEPTSATDLLPINLLEIAFTLGPLDQPYSL